MQAVTGARVVALNLGVTSQAELDRARAFWGAVLGSPLEDWGQGSQQLRLGPDEASCLFNIRIRSAHEPHYGHRSAFGLAVDDVDDFHRRALAAGAVEQFAPTDGHGMPRHSRFEDPVGNRVVLWQDEPPSAQG